MSIAEVTYVMQKRIAKYTNDNSALLGDIDELEIFAVHETMKQKSREDEDYPLKLACAVANQLSPEDIKHNAILHKYLDVLDQAKAFNVDQDPNIFISLFFPLIDVAVYLDNVELFDEISNGENKVGVSGGRADVVEAWAKCYDNRNSVVDSCVVRNAVKVVTRLMAKGATVHDWIVEFVKDRCEGDDKRVDYNEMRNIVEKKVYLID